jgi:ankyrin repeat protein
MDPVQEIIGRLLADESVTPIEATAAHDHAPDLVRVACELGKPLDVIRRLVELGWDVNAKNRTTALHEAAMHGALNTVQELVALGADPSINDDNFHAAPSGWAAHFGHREIQQYLDGLTS